MNFSESLKPSKHPVLINESTGVLNVELSKSTFPNIPLADVSTTFLISNTINYPVIRLHCKSERMINSFDSFLVVLLPI